MNTTIVRPATLPAVVLEPAAQAFADALAIAGGPKRLEIRVAPPAGPAAAQQPAANADDGEPTWEDAEWQ